MSSPTPPSGPTPGPTPVLAKSASGPHSAASRWRGLRLVALVVIMLVLVYACQDDDKPLEPDTLTVFAAASLHNVLGELASDFEAEHGVEVDISYAGSSALIGQLESGASADVLMTADERTMNYAALEGFLTEDPITVATNHLVLAVPAGNPGKITGIDESLTNAVVVVCATQVPCGAATRDVLKQFEVELSPASREPSVTDVLTKVASGQADAGFVYTSDALSAGASVEVIETPGIERVVNRYPAASVRASGKVKLIDQWLDFVSGPEGLDAFARAGFGTP